MIEIFSCCIDFQPACIINMQQSETKLALYVCTMSVLFTYNYDSQQMLIKRIKIVSNIKNAHISATERHHLGIQSKYKGLRVQYSNLAN